MPTPALGQGEEYELGRVSTRLYDPVHDSKIIDWRMLQFIKLGIGELDASALAARRDVDREHVQRLVRGGCSASLVKEIVL
jgi:hypothetical protein